MPFDALLGDAYRQVDMNKNDGFNIRHCGHLDRGMEGASVSSVQGNNIVALENR